MTPKNKIMQKVGGILLCTVILTINSAVNAQLKVNSDGRVGMNTNIFDWQFQCRIKGNLLLTGFPDNNKGTDLTKRDAQPYVYTGPIEMSFRIANFGNTRSLISVIPVHFFSFPVIQKD